MVVVVFFSVVDVLLTFLSVCFLLLYQNMISSEDISYFHLLLHPGYLNIFSSLFLFLFY